MSKEYTIKRYMGFVSLVLVFVFVLSTEAQAALSAVYDFGVVEDNSLIADDIAAQLSLVVTDNETTEPIGGEDHNQVLFMFFNAGPLASSITDVYFEDGSLLLLAEIQDDPSPSPNPVYFGQPASPGNLPGAATLDPDFDATSAFTVDSENGSPGTLANGVGPGESLGLLYTLQFGKDFGDVITAIELGFTNPDPEEPRESLRISLHVQGIDGLTDDDSDSFILTPEPASLLLGSIGIGMVIARCRKRKNLIES